MYPASPTFAGYSFVSYNPVQIAIIGDTGTWAREEKTISLFNGR
jgi:hypothetical protein